MVLFAGVLNFLAKTNIKTCAAALTITALLLSQSYAVAQDPPVKPETDKQLKKTESKDDKIKLDRRDRSFLYERKPLSGIFDDSTHSKPSFFPKK